MNPTKRKKMYRAQLAKKQSLPVQEKQEKVLQKEVKEEIKTVVVAPVFQETAPDVSSELEYGLKLVEQTPEVETVIQQPEAKKEKKKKPYSQE